MGCVDTCSGRILRCENTMKRIITISLFVGLVLGFLSGCGSTSSAPIINKSPSRNIPQAYEVKHQDSIYKIAWAFGVDYLDIAEWSNLKKPYEITPGQIVLLRKPATKITPLDPVSTQLREPEYVKKLPVNAPARIETSKIESAPVVSFSSSPREWNWPAEGKLIGKFSPSEGSNGIQIAGLEDSPVKATAAGEVVYVGEGLRGYGKLVILKHSTQFLSAYAHNRKILVTEGQAIAPEQQIATMGQSGTDTVMLHFEIRKDGEPVDPAQFLD